MSSGWLSKSLSLIAYVAVGCLIGSVLAAYMLSIFIQAPDSPVDVLRTIGIQITTNLAAISLFYIPAYLILSRSLASLTRHPVIQEKPENATSLFPTNTPASNGANNAVYETLKDLIATLNSGKAIHCQSLTYLYDVKLLSLSQYNDLCRQIEDMPSIPPPLS